MPTFLHPPLLWALGLVGLPVLIHLINMMRHRRVQWAAMEFLLTSQKKNRTWILFKQLLLLLLRMAAVALIVLVVAQPVIRAQWAGWFGGTHVHHVILLDDSYSMSDRWGDTSAFDEARAVIQQIGTEAARQVQPQQLTLLRFSHIGRFGRPTQPDLLQQSVDSEFATPLREKLDKMKPSQTAVGPIPALEAVPQLLGDPADEQRIVYLVTDFRARDWDDATDLRKHLLRLNETGTAVMLVNCIAREAAHPNLGIASLTPTDEIRAAGTPLSVELSVRNFGTAPVKNIPVLLEEDSRARPGVTINNIPAGRTVTERFVVNFPTAGEHMVAARLESDTVAADNFRYAVIDFPIDVPVLLVDGDPQAEDARRLALLFAPGGTVRTGITPRIETPRYLSLKPLADFRAIYLLNVDRLEQSAVKALEDYVTGGGGLAVFLGPRSDGQFYNEDLYRRGKGLFPVPLAGPTDLPVDRLQPAPDLEVTAHPVFRLITGQRNSDVATVIVQRYFAAAKGWRPPEESAVHVIARLRNGAPLAVEQRFGRGRVVAFLTTAAPVWNNWAQKGSFVAAMLNLQAYIGSRPADAARLVATPLRLELDPGRYQPQVRFAVPQQNAGPTPAVDAVAGANGILTATLPDTDAAGFYEAHLARTDGTSETRHYAINVDPAEGNLATIGGSQLAARLEGVRYQYEHAATFQYASNDFGGTRLGQGLLYLLVLLLLAEQLLAWSNSYHPPARHPLRAGGAL